MTNLHKDGGFAGYIGRPSDTILVPPSYGVTFFNKTLEAPLSKLGFNSGNAETVLYNESLGETNLKYTRVFHFNITDAATGQVVDGPYYVPYIESIGVSGEASLINTKSLIEVINPRFVKINTSEFIMYFYSNFNSDYPTGSSVSSEYRDNPLFLRRAVEFATNNSHAVGGSSSSSGPPTQNNLNLYAAGFPKDDEPKIAFLSCLIRMGNITLDSLPGSSEKLFVFAEKPKFITFVGARFALDFNPPVLINTTQKIEWAEDKEASDKLDDSAVKDGLQKHYYDLIDGISTVMYPGYAGINFSTQPITDVYDISLDHVFFVDGKYQKSIPFKSTEFYGISVSQKNLTNIDFGDSYGCCGITGSSSSSYNVLSSGLSPFQRQFVIYDIITKRITYSSSSSSSSSSSYINTSVYNVEVPSTVNIYGDDKPTFWRKYWNVCGVMGSSSSSVGIIQVYSQSKTVWEGYECINGIKMYATMFYKPYGYYLNERLKWTLIIGIMSADGGKLDVVWRGTKINDINPYGSYNRLYALGDGTSNQINVSKV